MNEEKKQPDDLIHDEGMFDPELSKKIDLRGHKWVQQGPYIICKSCPMRHSFHIGIGKELRGIDENGYPLFSTRS